MKNSILLFVFASIFLLTGLLLFPELSAAQPAPPGPPSPTPIDGGLALLAAAGGGYAIKKLKDRKE